MEAEGARQRGRPPASEREQGRQQRQRQRQRRGSGRGRGGGSRGGRGGGNRRQWQRQQGPRRQRNLRRHTWENTLNRRRRQRNEWTLAHPSPHTETADGANPLSSLRGPRRRRAHTAAAQPADDAGVDGQELEVPARGAPRLNRRAQRAAPQRAPSGPDAPSATIERRAEAPPRASQGRPIRWQRFTG
jgi:hypothetical protein